MLTLLIGILIVAGSAAGFGFALFGRRPIPQPAMQAPGASLGRELAEVSASSGGGVYLEDEDVESNDRWGGVGAPYVGRRARDVTITPWVRVRSSLMLALTVLGIAAILGAVLSVVVVAVVFVAT